MLNKVDLTLDFLFVYNNENIVIESFLRILFLIVFNKMTYLHLNISQYHVLNRSR